MKKLLGLPELASVHGADVDRLILYMHYLMILLFIGWSIFFVYTVWRFRQKKQPKANYRGVTNHFSNYVEVGVAVVEVLLLIGIAIPAWSRAVDKFPPEDKSTVIYVVAQQFAWNAIYPGLDGQFGLREMRLASQENKFGFVDAKTDPAAADDFFVINDLKVPVNKPVIVHISSLDVIHSFKVFPLRISQDAIPGMSIPVHFTPTKTGVMQINCAQLCGLGHYSMRGTLSVVTQEEYDKWLVEKVGVVAGAAGVNVFE